MRKEIPPQSTEKSDVPEDVSLMEKEAIARRIRARRIKVLGDLQNISIPTKIADLKIGSFYVLSDYENE